MRKTAVALLACLLCSLPAWSADPRQDFDSGRADAIKVAVYRTDGEGARPVRADQVFHQGDAIYLTLESNFPGYVYLVNGQPGGKTVVLLPSTEQPDHTLAPHQPRQFPAPPARILFDAEKGIETLRVVISRTPIPAYDQAVATHGLLAGADPFASAVGRASEQRPGVVETLTGKGRFASRGLYVSTPPDTTSSYVSVGRGDAGPAAHLEGNQTGVFEIHLKHQ